MGTPSGMFKITVVNTYLTRFRANFYVNAERPCIQDSFFVILDDRGEVEYVNPPIVQKYDIREMEDTDKVQNQVSEELFEAVT